MKKPDRSRNHGVQVAVDWPGSSCLHSKVPLTGLEPVVSALRGRRVNHLHYSGKEQRSRFSIHSLFHHRNGTPRWWSSIENERVQ